MWLCSLVVKGLQFSRSSFGFWEMEWATVIATVTLACFYEFCQCGKTSSSYSNELMIASGERDRKSATRVMNLPRRGRPIIWVGPGFAPPMSCKKKSSSHSNEFIFARWERDREAASRVMNLLRRWRLQHGLGPSSELEDII